MNFKDMAEQNESWIIEQRRYFHAHPELSFSLKEVEDQVLLSGLEKNLFDLIFVRKHMLYL